MADALGAYGLRVRGLEGAEHWMQPQSPDAPAIAVEVEVADAMPDDSPSFLDLERADIALIGGGRLRARRGEDLAHFTLPSIPSPAELLHPYLAPAAALAWQWLGREALHGGALDLGTGAVLVFGEKEVGKSTLLACLAQDFGMAVIADDLAVIDEAGVLAGPRSIDLRASDRDREGTPVRGGERVRVELPPVAPTTPLAGSVVLHLGSQLALTPVSPGERVALIAAQRTYPPLPGNPKTLLELVSQPMLILSRPRGLDRLRATATALMKTFA